MFDFKSGAEFRFVAHDHLSDQSKYPIWQTETVELPKIPQLASPEITFFEGHEDFVLPHKQEKIVFFCELYGQGYFCILKLDFSDILDSENKIIFSKAIDGLPPHFRSKDAETVVDDFWAVIDEDKPVIVLDDCYLYGRPSKPFEYFPVTEDGYTFVNLLSMQNVLGDDSFSLDILVAFDVQKEIHAVTMGVCN